MVTSALVSYATFAYLRHYLWFRVWHWLRRKQPKATGKNIRRRYFRGGSWPASHSRVLLNPTTVGTSRYRYRGAAIPTTGHRIATIRQTHQGPTESPLR